jgi:hypothetical protein
MKARREELFQFLKHMTQDERSYILTLDGSSKHFFTIIAILSWIFSTAMKYVMHNHLRTMKTEERPITFLIIIGQIIDYIAHTFVVANFVLILMSGAAPVDFLNTYFQLNIDAYPYCWTYCYITYFWIGYASYSAFGMALVRFLINNS